MKIVSFFILVCSLTLVGFSQKIDQERMDRDLSLATDVLSTLFKEQSSGVFRWSSFGKEFESSYVEGYGVIFSTTRRGGFSVIPVTAAQKINSIKGMNSTKAPVAIVDESADDADSSTEDFVEKAKRFLADYSHLINQLSSDNHISVKLSDRDFNYSFSSFGQGSQVYYAPFADGARKSKEMAVEAKVSDLKAYKDNSISRDELMSRITVTESETSQEKYKDLELFSSLFGRLYQSDLSSTYYTSRGLSYEKLSDYGVLFKMQLYSSFESGNGFFMPTLAGDVVTQEERNKKVVEALPRFEKEFKEHLVNYGRTIENLKPSELIRIDVTMTQCIDCPNFPSMLKFSVKKSVIDDYNKGNLSLEEAVAKVDVEKAL